MEDKNEKVFMLEPDEKILSFSTNGTRSFLVTNQGRVYGWGCNSCGKLGIEAKESDGYFPRKTSPTQIEFYSLKNEERVISISALERQTYAITNMGNVFGWGYGFFILDPHLDYPKSFNVDNKKVVKLFTGRYTTYALNDKGDVYAWGTSRFESLGDGSTTEHRYPTPIKINTFPLQTGEKITSISVGYHSLALTSHGRVFSWGSNSSGQLGDGTIEERLKPNLIKFSGLREGEGITAVSSGTYHSLALTSHGRIFSWGGNLCGILGDGTTIKRHIPTLINSQFLKCDEKFTFILADSLYSIAVTNFGRVFAWGKVLSYVASYIPNRQFLIEELENGIHRPVEVSISLYNSRYDSNEKIVSFFSRMEGNIFALTNYGRLFAWGNNSDGQLGNGTTERISTPTLIIDTPSLRKVY